MAVLPRTEQAVARSLAQTTDPRDALARALQAIGESLDWRLGAVWEPSADLQGALSCVETWSASGAATEEFEAVSRDAVLAAGEGLPGRVWRSGEPAWIPDVLADDNFPRAAAARAAGLHAAFCFPIQSARGVLGVIEFFTGEAREPDAELLATMSALGDQIGVAVERRRDAEVLSANEARHRAMLDAALDCVITMDHEGRVIDFNPAAERTFGYRASYAVGRDMAELIVPPELRERHRAGLARYLATEDPLLLDRRIEITGMRIDGTTFPVELTITRIDVPGPPTFTGYLRNIADRKAVEEELRASRARIVEAADDARRRLERDLHDGAQQRLVELALDLRMAHARLDDDDPARAGELLDAALADLEAATRSCASWPVAYTQQRSPRAACGRHSTHSRHARRSPRDSSRCPTRGLPRRWRPRRTSPSPRPSRTRPVTPTRHTSRSKSQAWKADSESRFATTAGAARSRRQARGCAVWPTAWPRSVVS